eukprot:TRINITY_DN1418_c1_g2_i1.p1 TRINITY_DN1418_c1_g2~~TRINITY_DN1418_c1_g2_i1.p1  ORF type:complete len:284 (+),score=32.69 TRINITY_DN1418_c1_g2_i1:127-978(+)
MGPRRDSSGRRPSLPGSPLDHDRRRRPSTLGSPTQAERASLARTLQSSSTPVPSAVAEAVTGLERQLVTQRALNEVLVQEMNALVQEARHYVTGTRNGAHTVSSLQESLRSGDRSLVHTALLTDKGEEVQRMTSQMYDYLLTENVMLVESISLEEEENLRLQLQVNELKQVAHVQAGQLASGENRLAVLEGELDQVRKGVSEYFAELSREENDKRAEDLQVELVYKNARLQQGDELKKELEVELMAIQGDIKAYVSNSPSSPLHMIYSLFCHSLYIQLERSLA